MDGCSRHCKLFCIIRVWEVEDESKGEEIRGSIGVCVMDRIQSHDIRERCGKRRSCWREWGQSFM